MLPLSSLAYAMATSHTMLCCLSLIYELLCCVIKKEKKMIVSWMVDVYFCKRMVCVFLLQTACQKLTHTCEERGGKIGQMFSLDVSAVSLRGCASFPRSRLSAVRQPTLVHITPSCNEMLYSITNISPTAGMSQTCLRQKLAVCCCT